MMRRSAKPSGMADLRYRVILEPEDDGSAYNVVIPAFPHGHTFGANVEECLANAREVIELELDYLRDKGLPIPESDHADAPIAFISVPSSAA
jgi:predicted RNase H-like HicB family nuclease